MPRAVSSPSHTVIQTLDVEPHFPSSERRSGMIRQADQGYVERYSGMDRSFYKVVEVSDLGVSGRYSLWDKN